jgi:hypothetical protein
MTDARTDQGGSAKYIFTLHKGSYPLLAIVTDGPNHPKAELAAANLRDSALNPFDLYLSENFDARELVSWVKRMIATE